MLVAAVTVLCGCADRGPVKRSWGRMKGLDKLVGNMSDRSYSKTRDKQRLNALGKPVSMASFAGKFVWSEYAASWCDTCSYQTPHTKTAKSKVTQDIEFLTIMTGKSREYNDHATVATAKEWAGRFSLPPERVLAAELWFKTIPEHRFYSPQGHTLFVHVGFLSSDQIQEVIAYYRPGWEEWAKSGVKAKWMTVVE